MVNEEEHVRQWLLQRHRITAPQEWLQACIEWIHEENQVPIFMFIKIYLSVLNIVI